MAFLCNGQQNTLLTDFVERMPCYTQISETFLESGGCEDGTPVWLYFYMFCHIL
jgi:hypothetical protein